MSWGRYYINALRPILVSNSKSTTYKEIKKTRHFFAASPVMDTFAPESTVV